MENQLLPDAKKEAEWKDVLTIVFLVLSPLVGLILMWWLADWTKKTKKIVTFVLAIPLFLAILGMLLGVFIVSFGGAREKSRDVMREADLRQMSLALSLYYGDNGVYPVSLAEAKTSLGEIPADPITKLPYEYKLQADGQYFLLCANFAQKEKQKEACIDSKGARLSK